MFHDNHGGNPKLSHLLLAITVWTVQATRSHLLLIIIILYSLLIEVRFALSSTFVSLSPIITNRFRVHTLQT